MKQMRCKNRWAKRWYIRKELQRRTEIIKDYKGNTKQQAAILVRTRDLAEKAFIWARGYINRLQKINKRNKTRRKEKFSCENCYKKYNRFGYYGG